MRLLPVILLLLLLPATAHAQASMRARYDAAEARGPGGDGSWYRDATNDEGLLAWGTSYAMMSFLVMFEATGDVRYLERLTYIADGVLEQRDRARGVTDYRGESNPCWQATGYGDDVPYCWAVHTGMIAYPMAELAALVARRPELAEVSAWDGETLEAKAAVYLDAAVDAAATHDADWRNDGADRGYYAFAPDASFTARPGQAVPLNMMNAMGRLHLAITDAAGDEVHRERTRRLANHFLRWTTTTAAGGYAWSYWPETYSAPGEDISHAAINVGFAARGASGGVVFGDAHLGRLATTAFDQVYVDTLTTYDRVGGSGTTNGSSYRAQFGRWLALDATDPRLHAAARATLAPYDTTSSGSLLYGFALLAATDHPQLPFRFYVVDWEDLGDRQRATAYGANILIRPPDPTRRYLVPLRYRASRRTLVQQWDGEAYHTVAKLAPTGAEGATAHVPYDPALYFDYSDGVLYQFHDAFAAGEGIELWAPESHAAPEITTTPPTSVVLGDAYRYEPAATGEAPRVWTADLPDLSPAMSFDAATGTIEWRPDAAGAASFTLRVHGDWGVDEQTWSVEVTAPPSTDAGPILDAGTPGGDAGLTDAGARTDAGTPRDGDVDAGCGCHAPGSRAAPLGWLLASLALLPLARARLRRRALRSR